MGAKTIQPAAQDLYNQDFFEWTTHNAELLRAGRFSEADITHIAEEIEDMGKSQRKELGSRLRVLMIHLLKWKFQPEHRSPSWEQTIDLQRAEIEDLLEYMPSLRGTLPDTLARIYPRAVRWAAKESQLSASGFPVTCPFTPEQVLDDAFLPE